MQKNSKHDFKIFYSMYRAGKENSIPAYTNHITLKLVAAARDVWRSEITTQHQTSLILRLLVYKMKKEQGV